MVGSQFLQMFQQVVQDAQNAESMLDVTSRLSLAKCMELSKVAP